MGLVINANLVYAFPIVTVLIGCYMCLSRMLNGRDKYSYAQEVVLNMAAAAIGTLIFAIIGGVLGLLV